MTARGVTLKAFSAGYAAAMRGDLVQSCPYKTKEMQKRWVAGYKEFEAKIRSIRK